MIESKLINHLKISIFIGFIGAAIGFGVSVVIGRTFEVRWLFALGGFLLGFLDPLFAFHLKTKV